MRTFVLVSALALAACGGGGVVDVVAPVVSPAATVVTLSGVAATGGAIAGRIFLKDSAGHEQFVDTTDGRFSFVVTGLAPPFMLKAQWTSAGTTSTLYSFAATGAGGTINITPLTHLALVDAAGTSALDAVYDGGSATALAAIAAALPAAVTAVQKAFAPQLAKAGAAAADPISTPFAPDHTGMDAVLDGIAIAYAGAAITVHDASAGALLLDGRVGDLAHALTVSGWSASDATVAADPDVAVAGAGVGLVAWSEVVAGHSVVRARFLGAGVGAAMTLSASGDAGLPKVAFDTAGDAIVAWTQYENGRNDIWASRFVAATVAWGAPVRLSAPNAVADANVPDVAVDGAGNAFVVWHQGDGRTNHFDVWSARYAAAGGTWSAPARLSDGVMSAFNPRVALNAAGVGAAAWTQGQDDGTVVSNGPEDIWARRLDSGSGVAAAATRINHVGGEVDGVYGQIAVAIDGQGNGFALWVQGSGTLPFVIHAARLSAANGWQPDTVITSNPLDSSYGPHVAFDAAGNAVAVWQQQTGVGAFGGVARFDAGTGLWGTSTAFGTDVAGDVYDPHVAIDGAGNATAVWYQLSDNAVSVLSSRSLAGAAWGASLVLDAAATGFTYPVPRVAANAAGRTIALWGIDSY
ncbi:MAG TPA: hypothetical protein VGO85_02530 [Caldimonas sp.]|nr:hypothetical protein [Caldimonas sp.]